MSPILYLFYSCFIDPYVQLQVHNEVVELYIEVTLNLVVLYLNSDTFISMLQYIYFFYWHKNTLSLFCMRLTLKFMTGHYNDIDTFLV